MQLFKLPSQELFLEIYYIGCSASVGSMIIDMKMLQPEKHDTKKFWCMPLVG